MGCSVVLSPAQALPTHLSIQCLPPPRRWSVPGSQASRRAPSCSENKKHVIIWPETDNYMLEKEGRARINVCGTKSVLKALLQCFLEKYAYLLSCQKLEKTNTTLSVP